MGDVVKFPPLEVVELRPPPNALTTIRRYFDNNIGASFNQELPDGDRFVAYLWLCGYKVIPLDADE